MAVSASSHFSQPLINILSEHIKNKNEPFVNVFGCKISPSKRFDVNGIMERERVSQPLTKN